MYVLKQDAVLRVVEVTHSACRSTGEGSQMGTDDIHVCFPLALEERRWLSDWIYLAEIRWN